MERFRPSFFDIVIVVAILGVLVAMCVPAYQGIRAREAAEAAAHSEDYALYRVWCRAYRSPASYEDWVTLRKAGLLSPLPAH